jgi:hypothetical protein
MKLVSAFYTRHRVASHDNVPMFKMQTIIAHMASTSSGFYEGQQYHLDMVRLGTALYGSEWNTSAFRWLTRITGIKQVTLWPLKSKASAPWFLQQVHCAPSEEGGYCDSPDLMKIETVCHMWFLWVWASRKERGAVFRAC